MDQFYAHFFQRPAKFTHRLCVVELLFNRRLSGSLVGGVLIQVETHWDAILPDIPPEAVHGGQGPLILVKSPEDLSGGVIDISHEHTGWPSALEPVMMGAVCLDHL